MKKRLFWWYSALWFFLLFALYQAYGIYFLDLTSTKSKWVGLLAGAIGLLLSSIKICSSTFIIPKNKEYKKIFNYFQEGSFVFNINANVFILALMLILSFFFAKTMVTGFVVSFILGVVFSIFLGLILSYLNNYSCSKMTLFLNEDISSFIKIGLNTAISNTFIVMGFFIVPMVSLYHCYKDYQIIAGYVLGVGLYTFFILIAYLNIKLTAKNTSEPLIVSDDIDSKDFKNPIFLLNGLIKTNVDIKITNLDLFFTCCLILVSSITIGALAYNLMGAFLPIIIFANGIFSAIIVALFLNINKVVNSIKKFYCALLIQTIIFSGASCWAIKTWIPTGKGLFISVLLGAMFPLILIVLNLKDFLSKNNSKDITNAMNLGAYSTWSQVIKHALKNNLFATLMFMLVVVFSFLAPDGILSPMLGLYGMSLCATGYVALGAMLLIIQNSAHLFKNAKHFLSYYPEVQQTKNTENASIVSDIADGIFAINKHYLHFATMLSAIITLIAYTLVAYVEELDILNPYILISLFAGSILGILFISNIFSFAAKNTLKLIFEIKKQFRKFPDIFNGSILPDYTKPVSLISRLVIPQVLYSFIVFALILFLILHFLKHEAVAGLYFGIVLSSYIIMLFCINIKFITKSAKKYFQTRKYAYKENQQYYIIELFSDVAGIFSKILVTSNSILIKIFAIVILALAPIFI